MAIRMRGTHTLVDYLNDTFSLVPRIWKSVLPVSIAAYVPGIALWIVWIRSLAAWIKDIAINSSAIGDDPTRLLSGVVPLLSLGLLASLALFLGEAFQKAFVCAKVGSAISGGEDTFGELAAGTLRPSWARVAVQEAVIGSLAYTITFAVIGTVFFTFFLSKLNDIVQLKGSGSPGIGFVIGFIAVYLGSCLVAGAAVWWLRVKTCVSAPATVAEGVNSFAGIGRSLELVRGRGWRIFGAMFIVSLVISFGLGIVTGPLAFIAIIPGYISFIKESLAGKTPSPEAIFALLSSMSWAIGITMLISGVVRGALWPSFLTMLHADLRIRAGEQAPWAEETTGDTALEAGGAVFEAGDPAHGEAEGGELV